MNHDPSSNVHDLGPHLERKRFGRAVEALERGSRACAADGAGAEDLGALATGDPVRAAEALVLAMERHLGRSLDGLRVHGLATIYCRIGEALTHEACARGGATFFPIVTEERLDALLSALRREVWPPEPLDALLQSLPESATLEERWAALETFASTAFSKRQATDRQASDLLETVRALLAGDRLARRKLAAIVADVDAWQAYQAEQKQAEQQEPPR
jgi:hypothetical protein